MSGIFICHFRVHLDIDDIEGDQAGFIDGSLQCIDNLLRAVGTGHAHEQFDLSLRLDSFQDLSGLIAGVALSVSHHDQSFYKCPPLLAHWRALPTDQKMFRVAE
jgi:hypothetical protein